MSDRSACSAQARNMFAAVASVIVLVVVGSLLIACWKMVPDDPPPEQPVEIQDHYTGEWYLWWNNQWWQKWDGHDR